MTAMIQLLILGRSAATWARRLEQAGLSGARLTTARLPAEGVRSLDESPPDAIVIVDDDGGARVPMIVQALQSRPVGRLLPILLVCPQPPQEQAQKLARELGLQGWLSPEDPPEELGLLLARALDMPVDALMSGPKPRHAKPKVAPSAPDITPLEELVAQDDDPLEADGADAPDATPQADADAATGDAHARAPLPRATVVSAGYVVEELPEPSALGPQRFAPPPSPVTSLDRASLFPVRAAQRDPGKVTLEVIRRKLREARHEDYFTLLEVRRGAEELVIKQAHQRLCARFDPEAIDFELARRVFQELAELRDALDDAWAVLGDSALREAYMNASARRAST